MDRARGSVDFGGSSRKGSIDLGMGGYDALSRPSVDAGAAPGRPGNDPGRAGERCAVTAHMSGALESRVESCPLA